MPGGKGLLGRQMNLPTQNEACLFECNTPGAALPQCSVLGTALGHFVGRNDLPTTLYTSWVLQRGTAYLLLRGMGLNRYPAPHQLRVKPCRARR